ncbi:ABC transporter permease [Desulfobacter postgatei]|jgi:peptide/nickel transport system permease protein|uniref:ABC transporter permease n=1 Tax=Desulfobacter postgatei TaxID=2293 RepID=UPI002A36E40C|nr:ABC transporter permease [Desulfobacter postgatei]MDX9963222.1 ABC transporter permease [Desulfobacter postgatei]
MKTNQTAAGASGRVISYLVTVWVIITLNFLLPRMMPGDPFVHLSGDEGEDLPEFTEAQKNYYMNQYGFDDSVPVQYARYLVKLAHGDLGESVYFNNAVAGILARRLPWTLGLVTAAVTLSTIIGTFLGVVSAALRHQWADQLLFMGLILISEIPAFLMGLVILFIFAAALDLFPLSGAMSHFTGQMTLMEKATDIAAHAALPVATLTLARLGGIYLLARNSLVTVLEKDFMVTARAKGLTKIRIFWRHALRNALLPIVTRVFMSLGTLVGGAVLVENVFNYPGLGKLLRESVMVQDYPLIQGIFLLVTLVVLSANFMADLVYRRLDPRVSEKPHTKRQRLMKA